MKLFKKFFLRILLISISVLFLIGCDQTTKQVAHRELKNKANQEIAGIINFQYIENDGGMLSIGKDFPKEIKFVIFILIVSVFLVIDFIRLKLPLIENGIFNIADFYVTIGFILLLISILKRIKIIIS